MNAFVVFMHLDVGRAASNAVLLQVRGARPGFSICNRSQRSAADVTECWIACRNPGSLNLFVLAV